MQIATRSSKYGFRNVVEPFSTAVHASGQGMGKPAFVLQLASPSTVGILGYRDMEWLVDRVVAVSTGSLSPSAETRQPFAARLSRRRLNSPPSPRHGRFRLDRACNVVPASPLSWPR
jgi:hypothetical protein